MNFQDLKYFQKLSHLKSYSKTANFFNVSQPTITYAIKRLETKFETDLIVRDSRAHTTSLSKSGEQLLIHIDKILFELDLAQRDINTLKNPKLKVGFPPIITNYFITAFKMLENEDLLSSIEPVTKESQSLMREVINGDIDLSLVGTANMINDSEFNATLLLKHKFKIVSARNHPLSDSDTDSVSLYKLNNQKMITLDESSMHYHVLDDLANSYNLTFDSCFRTSDFRLALDLIANDNGIGFFTETALTEKDKFNIYDPSELPATYFYIYLLYRKSKIENSKIAEIIDIFKKSPNNG